MNLQATREWIKKRQRNKSQQDSNRVYFQPPQRTRLNRRAVHSIRAKLALEINPESRATALLISPFRSIRPECGPADS